MLIEVNALHAAVSILFIINFLFRRLQVLHQEPLHVLLRVAHDEAFLSVLPRHRFLLEEDRHLLAKILIDFILLEVKILLDAAHFISLFRMLNGLLSTFLLLIPHFLVTFIVLQASLLFRGTDLQAQRNVLLLIRLQN